MTCKIISVAMLVSFLLLPVAFALQVNFENDVLGQCEYTDDTFEEQAACTASDVTISLLPGVGALTDARDATIYCYLATTQKEGLDIMLCGGSAAGSAASIGTVVTLPTVVGAAGSEAADSLLSVSKGIMKALRSAIKRGPGVEKLARVIRISDAERIKTFFKVSSTGNPTEELNIALRKMDAAVSTPSKRFALNTLSELDEDALKAGIKNIDEMDDAINGTETVLKNIKDFQKVAPEATPAKKVEFLKNVGKMSEEAAKDVGRVSDVKGVDNIAYNIATANSDSIRAGFEWEAKMGRLLRDNEKEIVEFGRVKYVDYKHPTKGWIYNAKVEMDILVKDTDGKIIAVEAKARDWEYLKKTLSSNKYNELLDDLESQFIRLRAVNDADKIRLSSKYPLTEEISALARNYGVEVKIGEVV